jgi:hypothetical protein
MNYLRDSYILIERSSLRDLLKYGGAVRVAMNTEPLSGTKKELRGMPFEKALTHCRK